MLSTLIQKLASENGFAENYILDAALAQDAPDGASTLILLLYPYDSWGEAALGCARISTYYFAAQEAYLKAKEMVIRLNQAGEKTWLCNEVRLKPLLSLLKDFNKGRNTLHYHKDYGSRFHIQTIGLASYLPLDEMILNGNEEKSDMCSSCRRCLQACPANALTNEGFSRNSCLRQHMLRATPMPEHLRKLMGNHFVGCDICQQVCPYNTHLPEGEAAWEGFLIDDLLKQDASTITRLSLRIGKNMASVNRVLAQACIVAGNSSETAHLPALNKLCHHPSPTVAEHAKWAVNILSIGTQEATI